MKQKGALQFNHYTMINQKKRGGGLSHRVTTSNTFSANEHKAFSAKLIDGKWRVSLYFTKENTTQCSHGELLVDEEHKAQS